VPISPKIIPRATSNPKGETLLIFNDIDATRSSFQNDGSFRYDQQKYKRENEFSFIILQFFFFYNSS
jgi:hypothetical protein